MPAVMKEKLPKPMKDRAPKPKNIISKLGVTAVAPPTKTKHSYNPVKSNRGVLFIKHIPHGFYEEQLKSYFEQFGSVTRTRVARSDRTGKSKGYAFVEFRVPEVAKIAADTMDNYLMFKQVLKTVYIAPDEQKYNYFRQPVRTVTETNGIERLISPYTQRVAKAVKKINMVPTNKQHENRIERALYKIRKAQEKYSNLAVDVDLKNVAHNQPEAENSDGTPVKKPSKKEQKLIAEAKRAARAARKSSASADAETSPSASGNDADESTQSVNNSGKKNNNKTKHNANNTLEKLLNETIGESEDNDSSDDTFHGDVSLVDSSLASEIVSSPLSSSASTSRSKKRALASVVTGNAKKTKKADTTLQKLLNETIDENDDDNDETFNGSIASATDVTIDTSLETSISSSLLSSPSPKKARKVKTIAPKTKQSTNKAEKAKSVEPEPVKAAVSNNKKSSSVLLNKAGIQKKRTQPTTAVAKSVNVSSKKAKQLIQSTADTVTVVKAGNRKKNKA